MRVPGLFAVYVVWAGLAVLADADPINVGILAASYPAWVEVVTKYGYNSNGTAHIGTTVIEETYWDSLNSLNASLEAVRRSNIVAVVGHYNKAFAVVTNYLRIPYFVTSLVPWEQEASPYHIRMIPDMEMYTAAIRDLFQHYHWSSAAVLYDTEEGSHIAGLMMEHIQGKRDLYDMRAYNLRHNSTSEVVRWALKDLRYKLVTNFLILCSPETTGTVLTQALYLSLLSRPNSWLVVNLGSSDNDLEPFIDSRANLTLIRLMVDPLSPECALTDNEISLSKAVHYDVFRMINGTNRTSVDADRRVSRSDVRRQLKTMDINGCTGNLNFTRTGKRNETFLQMLALQGLVSGANFNTYWATKTTQDDYRPWLIRLNGSGRIEAEMLQLLILKSGTWRSGKEDFHKRVQPSRTYSTMLNMQEDVFADKILRVTTKIEVPFVQWKNNTPEEGLLMDNNDRFEGFCIDILQEIAKMLNFQFNLTLVPDGKFGSKKPPPRYWTGMVKELIYDRADIALAPFSITPERSEVVDFTKPFMTKGTSVVVKKPERSVWPFQFLSPLSNVVWIAIFVSFVGVGAFLFGVTRVTSERKHTFRDDLKECFWYVWGTLLRADLSGSPTATSGRIISATWWFFSLIIVSIYTANLAAFLTINNAHIPITSAADLANQDIYDYGTVDGSQIESFFNNTKINHYVDMRLHMTILSPDSRVRRVENGFEKVLQEKYAFIWDSPTVRHATANNCDLMEIGTPFDLKGYGISTQKNSIYSEPLSMAVLALNDNGMLYRLEGKWWRRPNCPDPRSNAKSKAIEIEVASGMFIVLVSGVCLSALICFIQWIVVKKFRRAKCDSDGMNAEIQANHNHMVASPVDDNMQDATVVLSRTLSIGDNCVGSNRWEPRH